MATVTHSFTTGGTSVTHSFTTGAETTAPVVTVTVPAEGQLFTTANPTFTGTATDETGFDPDGAFLIVRLHDTTDDTYWSGSTWEPASFSYGYPLSPPDWQASGFNLTDGHTYELQARAVDAAGNTGFSDLVTFSALIEATAPQPDRTLVVDEYVPRHVITPTTPFYRAYFGDVRTGKILGELPITALGWSQPLNSAGSITASIPIIQPNDSITNRTLATRKATLWVEEDGEYVMGGILLTKAISGNTLSLAGEGFFSYLRRRTITGLLRYRDADQFQIAHYLASTYGAPVNISLGSGTCGVTRDRTYNWWDFKNVGEALEQLAAVENGFDFHFEFPKYEDGNPKINFVPEYPATGRNAGLVLEHERLGVTVVGYDEDGVDVTNTAITVGAGNDFSTVKDIRSSSKGLAEYVPLETVFSHSSVTKPATLNEHAGRHLARNGTPITRAKVRVVRYEGGPSGYRTGDIAHVYADNGLLEVDQLMRIVNMSVTYDGGTRIADLDLVGMEVFT